MVTTRSESENYRTAFATQSECAVADAPVNKGGTGAGFGPHELLEAAFATCINMAVRMRASELGLRIGEVTSSVRLDRSAKDRVVFEYTLEIQGNLSEEERAQLLQAADSCPVRQTLSKLIAYKHVTEPS
jgi:putative redox protein